MLQQSMGRSIKRGRGNDISSMVGHICEGVIERRLPACRRQRADTAFQLRDASLEYRRRRVCNATVAKSFLLKIEQGGCVVRTVELIGHGLIDWDGDRACGRVALIAAMHSNRFFTHYRLVTHRPPIRPSTTSEAFFKHL